MLNRLKISLILAPLALTMLIGVYVYTLWSEERERSAETPFDSSGAMNRDLLKFHEKRGSFPEKLEDLEGVVWKKKDRNYVSGGRSMFHRNYFYLYTKVGPHRFTLWAIPIGRLRDDAPTFHLIGTPRSHRTWKGPAVPIPDVEKLSVTPSSHNLNILGLVEQSKTSASATMK
ncbi:MAG: hypothetical protein AB7V11_17580 [Pyrinomonadaceae bacterium]